MKTMTTIEGEITSTRLRDRSNWTTRHNMPRDEKLGKAGKVEIVKKTSQGRQTKAICLQVEEIRERKK